MITGHQSIKFDITIIDPDMNSRMRLKQATTATPYFGKIQQFGEMREATMRLSAPERNDVTFISHKYEMSDIQSYIKSAKESKSHQDTAFILVLGAKNQDSSTVASSVLSGFDGFLFEPYSVDNLLDITQISAKVKKERSQAREEAAMKLLITDMMNQLDLLAYLKQSNSETTRLLKKLKDTAGFLKTLNADSTNVYLKVAVDTFENAPLPTKVFQKKTYGGASSRIKRKMEDKLLAELEKESSSSKTS